MKKYHITRRTDPKRSYSFRGRMKCFLKAEVTLSTPDKQIFSLDWLTRRKQILNPKKKRDYELLLRVFDTPKTANDKEVRKIEYLFAVEEGLSFDDMVMGCLRQAWEQVINEHEKTDFFIDTDRSYAEVRA
ncbi:MAG: hypothetical protein KGV51_04770 [Moraxellaceae bacterium]|nr:hypothetical protein [Moraxellaceae bacterium]